MSPAYPLAAGALAAAYLGQAAGAFFALALFLPRKEARAFGLGALFVTVSLFLQPNPWEGLYGETLTLSGPVESGVLKSERGRVYLELYPRPDGVWLSVRGRLLPPKKPRNPGEFDQAAYLRGKGVYARLVRVEVLTERPLKDPKARLRKNLTRGLSSRAAALARALVLGEREALGAYTEAFRRAGLAHLLALSGLHIGIIAAALLVALFWLGPWRYPLAFLLIVAYLFLVGPMPSLVRAVLMAGAAFLTLFLGWGRAGVGPALATALALHLTLAPYALFDLGFRLSYLAVAGLWLILGPLRPGLLTGALLATPAAQAATLPLVLDAFGYLPLLSPLANLLALPLVAWVVVYGLARAFLPLPAAGLELPAALLLDLAQLFAKGPKLLWGEISPPGFWLYYLALAALVLALHRRLSPRRAALVSALAALFSLAAAHYPALSVWQLDVGEGHATLVKAPGGVEVLIDTGPAWAGGRVVRAHRALGIHALDLLVLTHADADHTGAALRLLAEVPVGAVVVSPPHPADDPAITAARLAGVPILVAGAGDRLKLGPYRLRFLHPGPLAPPGDNAKSLVVETRWRGRALLVLGDLPRRYEEGLAFLPADVLVASHHGAEDGTGERVLAAARPRVVLVGVGKNPYGHPSEKTLARVLAHGAYPWRTDLFGAVRVLLVP